MKAQSAIDDIKSQIEKLEAQLETAQLLEAVWTELGPYTTALLLPLLLKLQRHFDFDDSE